MLSGLFIASLIGTICQGVKEALEKPIPAENWANKELIHQDRMKGISEKEFYKNLSSGKYKQITKYPEPHRTAEGKIIIENCTLYKEDVRKYGAVQAQTWVKQGKYNLSPEELEKERTKYREKWERIQKLH